MGIDRAALAGTLPVAGALLLAGAALVRAGTFPDRPLVLIAPANPGGGWDQTARLMQHVITTQRLSPVPLEVVNRGGAGGTIGLAELVARHRRDPHTIMIGGAVMLGAIITHASPYTLSDTVPLARLTNEYEVVAVPSGSPYSSLPELIDAFRRDPASVTWGGGSAGGLDHVLVGLLAQQAGVPPHAVRYVAFTGGGEAAAAVMGGQVTAGVSGYGEWKPHARSGRMRLLAMSSPRRIKPDMPPAFRDVGVDLVVENWRGVVAPPGIAQAERQWLVDLLQRMRATAEWRVILERNDWEDAFLEGEAFEQFLRQDLQTIAATLSRIALGAEGRGYAAMGPWVFPGMVGLGLAASLLAIGLAARRGPAGPPEPAPGTAWLPLLGTVGLLALLPVALERVGFLTAASVYLVVQARVLGSRRLRRDVVVSVALVALTFVVFTRLLHVSLPAWIPSR